ncbi:molecular chaperone TorD family protein [Chelativorans sp. M5D2P16]|uniref:molecular chaperone TorD family protein n=1 Tax=Chelativorans sp. M5D2P16 TaxID=3095678 RepID=UPI002ACA12DA|nr:molecular chaperone TorD family protein [Chelativorans sp. M5D2P16]MDZ5698600.1 molecular chaperone TorD family protein [Chelativorans sp. M5D2P16]
MDMVSGLEEAIRKAGGVGAFAQALGLTPSSVSAWQTIPAEHVLEVEAVTGVARTILRPDLYPEPAGSGANVDEVDMARAQEYALLGSLLLRAPNADTLARLSMLQGTDTPFGAAHIALGQAANAASPEALRREYFDLFEGVGRGELLPYASYYLTGFLNERPLARLREDLKRLGLERAEGHCDPEDHLGTLCEIMSGLAGGRFEASTDEERDFFERHIARWAGHFFADLEKANAARFYRAVGTVGRLFIDIEAEGFAMETRRSA